VVLEEQESEQGKQDSNTRCNRSGRAAVNLERVLITGSVADASAAIDDREVARGAGGGVAISIVVVLVRDGFSRFAVRGDLEPLVAILTGLADVLVVGINVRARFATRAVRVFAPCAHTEAQSGNGDQSQQGDSKGQLHAERGLASE